MVVHQVQIVRIAAREAEDEPVVAGDGQAPIAFQVALQRVQLPTRHQVDLIDDASEWSAVSMRWSLSANSAGTPLRLPSWNSCLNPLCLIDAIAIPPLVEGCSL